MIVGFVQPRPHYYVSVMFTSEQKVYITQSDEALNPPKLHTVDVCTGNLCRDKSPYGCAIRGRGAMPGMVGLAQREVNMAVHDGSDHGKTTTLRKR